MSLIRSGVSPVGVYLGDIEAERVYLGDILIWEKGQPIIVLPTSARATATAIAPTLSAGHVLQVPPATATAQGVAPDCRVVVLPPPATATAAGLVAKIRNGASLAVPPASAAASVWVPEVRVTTGVVAVPAEASALALPPSIQVGAVLDVPAATATADVLAPTVRVVLDVPAATGSAHGLAPALAISANIEATAATATATAVPPTVKIGQLLTDDFNRADGGLGASWTTLGTAPVIATNRVQGATPSLGQTVYYAARHSTALTSDSQEVSFTPIAATAGATPSLGGGAFLRSDTSGSRVEIAITNNQIIIGTRISGTATNRATATVTPPTTVRATAIGNVYSAYLDGSPTPAVTWTDSGNVIPIGVNNRFAGVVLVANTSFGSVTTRGWALDSWTAQDL
ncbi:hypothetical protein AB0H58_31305 [Nocardia neocaledoniensis]|uniref:hypothetical protein n=1 Tax=Nocardia neocaledoniensis TaxID=236511 RepID=UPI0033DCB037